MTTPCRTINANPIAAPSPSGMIFNGLREFVPIDKRLVKSSYRGFKLPSRTKTTRRSDWSFRSPGRFLSSCIGSASASAAVTSNRIEALEEGIEKVIYQCRFMALLGTLGSLLGSVICFIKVKALQQVLDSD